MNSKLRNSNLEILRIISIIMIVVSHYCVHGGVDTSTMSLGINRFLLEIFTLGNFGSILFILISGYFMINSKEIKLKKILKLILQIMFYSISVYFILVLIGKVEFSIITLIKNALPITFKQYWFATAYVVLYLLSPFINKFLNSISKKEHLIFILVMLFIFSIMHTITNNDYYGNELIEFVMFYSIGAYLSKYPNKVLKKNNLRIALISAILIIISVLCFEYLGAKISFFSTNSRYFLRRSSPLLILFCISLFDYFSSKKEFNNKFINTISSLIFGVYLISDNNYIRSILWIDTFKNTEFISSPYLILHMIISVILTVVVCLIIEYIRKNIELIIFKKIDDKIDKLQINITKKFNKIIDRIS